MPSTILDLTHRLRSGNSAAPRLTWYGPDGERIELSGRVLDNWVAKTSNFLSEELDAERGTRVRIDLPAHWKSVVIALAALQTGAVLVDDGEADITFVGPEGTAAHDGAAAGGVRVAVALGALEMAFPGELPPGTLDYAALVRQFADSYEPFDPPAEGDRAVDGARSLSQGELFSEFAAPTPDGARVLVAGSPGLMDCLAQLLGAWAAGGSAVLAHASAGDVEHLRRVENVTG
jgi:uncharacterized protein (TIGR03089 family)